MQNLTYGRALMGSSLGIHIILAVLGMALPLYISLAEGIGIWRKNQLFLILARRWASAFAILFAVGAATGVIVAFELSLLWPNFMAIAGQVIALPFAIEGFAFFIEAIFLGIYIFGWDRIKNPVLHWLASLPIVVSAAASGLLITIVNAWMNSPAGFTYQNGKLSNVQPIKAMLNPATPTELLHVVITAYLAVGVALAGITAITMLRGRRGQYYRQALSLTMLTSLGMAVLAVLSGDMSGKYVAQYQPAKLAAMEALYHTQARAPENLILFKIPGLASFLATGNPNATLQGLDAFAKAEQPPIIIHYFFLGMVGLGMTLAALTLGYALLLWKRPRLTARPWVLWPIAIATPFGFLAIEFGWMVTEIGRQPWIIYHLMTVSQALTLSPYVPLMFWTFLPLYVAIAGLTAWALLRYFRTHPLTLPATAPKSPTPTKAPHEPAISR